MPTQLTADEAREIIKQFDPVYSDVMNLVSNICEQIETAATANTRTIEYQFEKISEEVKEKTVAQMLRLGYVLAKLEGETGEYYEIRW